MRLLSLPVTCGKLDPVLLPSNESSLQKTCTSLWDMGHYFK